MSTSASDATTAANKQVIKEYLDALSRRDWPTLAAKLHPDAVYWVSGTAPYSGVVPVKQRVEGAAAFMDTFSRYSFTTHLLLGEGDRVVAEGSPHGEGADGQVAYSNTVVMVFRLRDGLIVEKREYMDVTPQV